MEWPPGLLIWEFQLKEIEVQSAHDKCLEYYEMHRECEHGQSNQVLGSPKNKFRGEIRTETRKCFFIQQLENETCFLSLK